jgi:hypothetical protein
VILQQTPPVQNAVVVEIDETVRQDSSSKYQELVEELDMAS